MDKHINKISVERIREIRGIFIRFPEETGFPAPERLGDGGLRYLHEREAVYDRKTGTYVERKCYEARKLLN